MEPTFNEEGGQCILKHWMGGRRAVRRRRSRLFDMSGKRLPTKKHLGCRSSDQEQHLRSSLQQKIGKLPKAVFQLSPCGLPVPRRAATNKVRHAVIPVPFQSMISQKGVELFPSLSHEALARQILVGTRRLADGEQPPVGQAIGSTTCPLQATRSGHSIHPLDTFTLNPTPFPWPRIAPPHRRWCKCWS